jgi:hypothetical protein
MTLTDTQQAILAAAARHPEHLAYPPARLPTGARQTVAKAMLNSALVVAVHRAAYDAVAKWTVDGDDMLLQITAAGLRAITAETALKLATRFGTTAEFWMNLQTAHDLAVARPALAAA